MFWSLLADEVANNGGDQTAGNPWMMYIVLTAGKSYIKMDKELIAQTDAKGPTQIAREEAEARRKAEEAEKKAKKSGEVPAPVPAREDAEEKSEPAEAKNGSAEEKEEK